MQNTSFSPVGIVTTFVFVLSMLLPETALAAGGSSQTVVTTYVVKTQEKRQSTRFTLTEWLRIKERMKLMDVWLAMFSKPQETFSPELNLSYLISGGALSGDLGSSAVKAQQASGQLWLTNLVSATTRLRTVNIDLGFEGRSTNAIVSSFSTGESSLMSTPSEALSSSGISGSRTQMTSMLGSLRLFGKNIQDSSLVVKGGQYYATQEFLTELDPDVTSHNGSVYGANLQLYLVNWLGVEGEYLKYSGGVTGLDAGKISGQHTDYMAFIEISLLRLVAGKYQESWQLNSSSLDSQWSDSGYIAGLKLQL